MGVGYSRILRGAPPYLSQQPSRLGRVASCRRRSRTSWFAFLKTLTPQQFQGAAERTITLPFRPGKALKANDDLIAFNGLAFNGLSSPDFTAWFNTDPALADMVMHYLVQCAVQTGSARYSTARACGLTGQAEATRDACEPIAYVGSCRT